MDIKNTPCIYIKLSLDFTLTFFKKKKKNILHNVIAGIIGVKNMPILKIKNKTKLTIYKKVNESEKVFNMCTKR